MTTDAAPLSKPNDPPSRLRWAAPFALGFSAGGLVVAAAVALLSLIRDRPAEGLAAERLDIARVLDQAGCGPNVRVTNDDTDPVGSDGGRPGTYGTAVRRRIVVQGTLPAAADLPFATGLRTQLDNELARQGVQAGGGSTGTWSLGMVTASGVASEFSYFYWARYHRKGRTGRMDVELTARGAVIRAVIVLYEAR